MIKIPVIISFVITILAIIIATTLFKTNMINLSDSENLQALFSIIASWGAFISATFIIYSYLQTNLAFVESQRPQLLIQVDNHFTKSPDSTEKNPVTEIHYRNITTNMFRELTITVRVVAKNHDIDLSDLFKHKMVMVGTDQRQRKFSPLTLLRERGLNLNQVTSAGEDVFLKLTYSYTYNSKTDTVQIQEYKWNPPLQVWEIV